MADEMFLDDDEVAALTQRRRRPAQSKVLTFMGIEHRMRPDGSFAVLRAHVEKLFGEGVASSKKQKIEPRFDLVT